MMNYESNRTLKLKSKSGIMTAFDELTSRELNKIILNLAGINGETIYFVNTDEVKKQIMSIEVLYDKLNVKDDVNKDILLLDSYHSATIEGARTTVDNVKRAIINNSGSKDDKMVINNIQGFYYALNNELTINNLIKLWEIVIKDVCENEKQRGNRFRTGMVYISSNTKIIHTPELPGKIEIRVDNLFNFLLQTKLNPLLNAAILHFYFVYIHPFCDGNGRTARILLTIYLDKLGMGKFKSLPIIRIINENLSGYYKSLYESEQVEDNELDITPSIAYVLNIFEQAILSHLAGQNMLSEIESLILSKIKNNKSKEISINTLSKILKISLCESEELLKELEGKGFLNLTDYGTYKLIV